MSPPLRPPSAPHGKTESPHAPAIEAQPAPATPRLSPQALDALDQALNAAAATDLFEAMAPPGLAAFLPSDTAPAASAFARQFDRALQSLLALRPEARDPHCVQRIRDYSARRLHVAERMLAGPMTPQQLRQTCCMAEAMGDHVFATATRRAAKRLWAKAQRRSLYEATHIDHVPVSQGISVARQALPLVPVLKRPLHATSGRPDKPQRVSAIFAGLTAAPHALMGPECARGTFCQVRPVLTALGEQRVARVLHFKRGDLLAGQGRAPGRRRDTDVENFIAEHAAIRAAKSPLQPSETWFDSKARIYSLVPAYDLDLMELANAAPALCTGSLFTMQLCRDVLFDLSHLHSRGGRHRDIKPENILLRRDGAMVLADYGLATLAPFPGSPAGTLNFVAPEVILGQSCDHMPAQDLFSLGMTLLAVLDSRYVGVYGNWIGAYFKAAERHKHAPKRRDEEGYQAPKGSYGESYYRWTNTGGILAPSPDTKPRLTQVPSEPREPGMRRMAWLLQRIDPSFADLVMGRLVHPDPAQRGTAAEALRELDGHKALRPHARRGVIDRVRRHLDANPKVAAMDAAFSMLHAHATQWRTGAVSATHGYVGSL